MVQRLKEHIREKILSSSRLLFAERGISNVTMAQIAEKSSISTGNLYHYFPDKDTLVAESIPESFGKHFVEALEDRFTKVSGKYNPAFPIMQPMDDDLIDLVISCRTMFVVVFYHESLYPEMREQCHSTICELAIDRACSFGLPRNSLSPEHLSIIGSVYRSLIRQMAWILFRHTDREQISESIRILLNYHISGIPALFRSCEPDNGGLRIPFPQKPADDK